MIHAVDVAAALGAAAERLDSGTGFVPQGEHPVHASQLRVRTNFAMKFGTVGANLAHPAEYQHTAPGDGGQHVDCCQH